MTASKEKISCDLLVIGTGMAGMAASLFAAKAGIDTIQAGLTGEIAFASGLLDLLGVHPVKEGARLDDPWEGMARLVLDEPRHPYARLQPEVIRHSVQTVLDFFEENGYPHEIRGQLNQMVMTPLGTVKPTYALPHTMSQGVRALEERCECLLVDFQGLKGYSARQIAGCMAGRWPDLHHIRIDFPNSKGELYPEQMARSMDAGPVREQVIAAIRPHIGAARAVGLPAVLGMYRTTQVMDDLQQGLGIPAFEIPTMLPGVAGVRLRELFEHHLPALGVRTRFQQQVLHTAPLPDGRWQCEVGSADSSAEVTARSVILCSGRFFGKGLKADRHGIRETLFDLPVDQPGDRSDWHHKDLLHPEGHPINRAGVAVDRHFRPVDANGQAIYPNLFAAGSILAHQDWIRQKCGSGLAIATAAAAVSACQRVLTSD